MLWIERITVAFFALDYLLRLFTVFLPVGNRSLPHDSNRTYFPFVPNQRLLRFLTRYHGGYLRKAAQLISSVVIIMILMVGSSLCMYSLEHEAQPDVFQNAFSGVWWAASTLLTVGYGDIYPVTALGKIFGIFITFLGVGMVGHSYRYYFRRLCGPVFPLKAQR